MEHLAYLLVNRTEALAGVRSKYNAYLSLFVSRKCGFQRPYLKVSWLL